MSDSVAGRKCRSHSCRNPAPGSHPPHLCERDCLVDAIADMRNIASVAHGHGSNRIAIRDYHARLAINSAAAVSEFVLSVQGAKYSG